MAAASTKSIAHVARAALRLRAQAQAAIAGQQQAVAKLDELLANLAPQELAKAATRPTIRFALGVVENKHRPMDDRLRAASLLLGLGHGNAPKAVDLTARVDTVRRVTPEALRAAATAFLQAPVVDLDP